MMASDGIPTGNNGVGKALMKVRVELQANIFDPSV